MNGGGREDTGMDMGGGREDGMEVAQQGHNEDERHANERLQQMVTDLYVAYKSLVTALPPLPPTDGDDDREAARHLSQARSIELLSAVEARVGYGMAKRRGDTTSLVEHPMDGSVGDALSVLRRAGNALRGGFRAYTRSYAGTTPTDDQAHALQCVDSVEGVLDLFSRVYLLDSAAGPAGWEVLAWAVPRWEDDARAAEAEPITGVRTDKDVWMAAWACVLRGQTIKAVDLLKGVEVEQEDEPASHTRWAWPSEQYKRAVLDLLEMCPTVRAMEALVAEGGAAMDSREYAGRRQDVRRAVLVEFERWRDNVMRAYTNLPRDAGIGVRVLLGILSGRENSAERVSRQLLDQHGQDAPRPWRMLLAARLLYEKPDIRGREIGAAVNQALTTDAAIGGYGVMLQDWYDDLFLAIVERDLGRALELLTKQLIMPPNTSHAQHAVAHTAMAHLVLYLAVAASHCGRVPSLRFLVTPVLFEQARKQADILRKSLVNAGLWREAIGYALMAYKSTADEAEGWCTRVLRAVRLHHTDDNSRAWVQGLGQEFGGGLGVAWEEASVRWGAEALDYAQLPPEDPRAESLGGAGTAADLWARTAWGRAELAAYTRTRCEEFLHALADQCDSNSGDPAIIKGLGDEARAILNAVFTSPEGIRPATVTRQHRRRSEPASPADLAAIHVPELYVLLACQEAREAVVEKVSLRDAMQALVKTLPPNGTAPRSLWPAILRACTALLQVTMRDVESSLEPLPCAIARDHAYAILTCLAEIEGYPRLLHANGGPIEVCSPRAREALVRALGLAIIKDQRTKYAAGQTHTTTTSSPLPMITAGVGIKPDDEGGDEELNLGDGGSAFDLLAPHVLLVTGRHRR